jgi:flagellin-like protein
LLYKISCRSPKSLRKYRRGVSPIIGTVFLIAIFVTAIGVSLGFVYPYLLQIEDQSEVTRIATNLEVIDENIRKLLTKSPGSSVSIAVPGFPSGIFADSDSSAKLLFKVNDNTRDEIDTSFSRLIIQSALQSDIYQDDEIRYLRGSQNQDFYTLNEDRQSTAPWTILELSKPAGLNALNISLGYRFLVSSSSTQTMI